MAAPIKGNIYIPSSGIDYGAEIIVRNDAAIRDRVITTYNVYNPNAKKPDDPNPKKNDKYLLVLAVYKENNELHLESWEAIGGYRENEFPPGYRPDVARLAAEDSVNRGLEGKVYGYATTSVNIEKWEALNGYEHGKFIVSSSFDKENKKVEVSHTFSPKEPLLQSMIEKPMISLELFKNVRDAEAKLEQDNRDKKHEKETSIKSLWEFENSSQKGVEINNKGNGSSEVNSEFLPSIESREPLSNPFSKNSNSFDSPRSAFLSGKQFYSSEIDRPKEEPSNDNQQFQITESNESLTESPKSSVINNLANSTDSSQEASQNSSTPKQQTEDKSHGCVSYFLGLISSLCNWIFCFCSKAEPT